MLGVKHEIVRHDQELGLLDLGIFARGPGLLFEQRVLEFIEPLLDVPSQMPLPSLPAVPLLIIDDGRIVDVDDEGARGFAHAQDGRTHALERLDFVFLLFGFLRLQQDVVLRGMGSQID